MSLLKTTSYVGKVGIVLSFVIAAFLVSDAAAQEQICECVDAYDTVAVRTVPVRRVARKYRAKRAYRRTAVRRVAVTRPATRTVYVPVRRVEYVPQYVAYDDDCDDEMYTTVSRRVYVTDRVRTNAYVTKRIYTNGSFGNLAVDSNYFETARIASDYGHRDGFNDGFEVAMERETYLPYKEGDYRNGTNGYEDDFGDKDLYKQAYRNAYLRGYDAGFRSVAQSSTYSVIRY